MRLLIFTLLLSFVFTGCENDIKSPTTKHEEYYEDSNGNHYDYINYDGSSLTLYEYVEAMEAENNGDPYDCEQSIKNGYLYILMQDYYFWYSELPQNIDYLSYKSEKTLLTDLMYAEYDRFSYISDRTAYANHYAGKSYGLGYARKLDNDANWRVAYVYKDSPVDLAGITRGDKFISINGKTTQELDDEKLWDSVLGGNNVDEDDFVPTADFTMEKPDGTAYSVTITKAEISVASVMFDKIVEYNDKKIGFFTFKSFINGSADELDSLFAEFKEAGIDELVVDLRYNGGGLLSAAQHLASLIGGDYTKDKTFCTLKYSDKYSNNSSFDFTSLDNNLSLKRVFFITTGSSCSASEAVINGLSPYIKTVIVGTKTCGKPIGMNPRNFCDRTIAPITFNIVNGEDYGDYFDGLVPQCETQDNPVFNFADENSDEMKVIFSYVDGDGCPDETETKKGLNNGTVFDESANDIELINGLIDDVR